MTRTIFGALALAATLMASSSVSAATNLLVNPSNEDALVNGDIPGWTEVQGGNWTQRSASPTPQDGSFMFFPGVAAFAILRQVVDVSSFAAAIDAGTQSFTFSGYRQSYPQSPADAGEFEISLLDSSSSSLTSILSGQSANTSSWDFYTTTFLAPVGTRFIQVDLRADRNAGSNNDANFDNLSLTAAATAPVPLPAAGMMLVAGLAGFGMMARRRNKR